MDIPADPNQPELKPKEPEGQATKPAYTSPNDELAHEVTDALVKTGVVAAGDAVRCQKLLESGNAKPEDWSQLVEDALFSKAGKNDG